MGMTQPTRSYKFYVFWDGGMQIPLSCRMSTYRKFVAGFIKSATPVWGSQYSPKSNQEDQELPGTHY